MKSMARLGYAARSALLPIRVELAVTVIETIRPSYVTCPFRRRGSEPKRRRNYRAVQMNAELGARSIENEVHAAEPGVQIDARF